MSSFVRGHTVEKTSVQDLGSLAPKPVFLLLAWFPVRVVLCKGFSSVDLFRNPL